MALSADELARVLEPAEALAARAMRRHPFLTGHDVIVMALAGVLRAVGVFEGDRLVGLAMLEVVEYPRDRACNVFALAGDRGFAHRLDALHDWLTRYADEAGCTVLMIAAGRPAWARLARRWRAKVVESVLVCRRR